MTNKKICGIVAEYNPFHNGHIHHIEETKKQYHPDYMIAVMSGNFVQRGEPAIIDKWTRASFAVQNGIDLVIELPYIYATQSANAFAHGAITLLKQAGITALSFGSECGNLENLKEIAETPVDPDHIRQSLDQGMSFPKAYSLLSTQMLPNDILAIAYLKEIQDTSIEPILIPRTSNYHGEELFSTCSAYAIRQGLLQKQDISQTTVMHETLQKEPLHYLSLYYPYFRTLLLTTPKEDLANRFLVSEGIENHLIRVAKQHDEFDAFLKDAVNWRYTKSRIQRTMLHIMNQDKKEEVHKLPPLDTLRILAFNEKGKEYLHEQRKKEIRFASRFAKVPSPYREMEYRSTLLYTSILEEQKRQQLLTQEIAGALYIKAEVE